MLALVWLAALAGGRDARALDEARYAKILERYTVEVGDVAMTRVDYAALRSSPEWEALLRSLRYSDPQRLRTRNEKLAFWINAYNILAMDLVRRHYPIDSIRSIGSMFRPVWKRPAGVVGGRTYTLHEIEHDILRPMGDPRIHGAIVCASLSCPPLRREPYRAAVLDAQLEDNLRRWLRDPRKGVRIDRATGAVSLSPIFDWFAADFGDDVFAFVAQRLPDDDARWLRAHAEAVRIRPLSYDWRLNDASGSAG